MSTLEFLREKTIISVGNNHWTDYVCLETITEEPDTLVKIALDEGYYISEIRWWDRAFISTGSDIGSGGPRDPREPDVYYFAEMDTCDSFSPTTSVEEYIHYMNVMKARYRDYDIYPAFDIKPMP